MSEATPFNPRELGISSVQGALTYAFNNMDYLYGKSVTITCHNTIYNGDLYHLTPDLVVLRLPVKSNILSGPHKGKSPVQYTFISTYAMTSIAFELPEEGTNA
ncbi:MAG: hypothetical protein AB7H97_03240 [Pseudobdellovibrionaceae bacterium]